MLPTLTPPVGAGTALTSYTFGSDGMLRGVFSDGIQRDMAQLASADFANVMGLEKIGETAYRASANSGAVQLGVPGQDGAGTIIAGALEMSNVELAAEFTNLILAQRGFQASAQVTKFAQDTYQTAIGIGQR